MKTRVLLLFAACAALISSCDEDDERNVALTEYSLCYVNKTSSDLTFVIGTYRDTITVLRNGAFSQTVPYELGEPYNIEDNLPTFAFTTRISVGDSTLVWCRSKTDSFLHSYFRDHEVDNYSEGRTDNVYHYNYTFTDDVVKRMVYYCADELNYDMVER